jgi:hypothetical protein
MVLVPFFRLSALSEREKVSEKDLRMVQPRGNKPNKSEEN